jgi:hypothetical protein
VFLFALGVVQCASKTISLKYPLVRFVAILEGRSPILGTVSNVLVVGHEVQTLPDVRRADACSRESDRPAGVSNTFQVILNKIEPAMPNRAFNLFAKDSPRTLLANEMEPRRP